MLLSCEAMQVDKLVIFEMQAKLCSLMANTKRLMIMDFLSRKQEACVGDIAEDLNVSVSVVSQHWRLMRDNSIVLSRKDGHTVFYRLKHPKIMAGCQTVREVLMDELRSRGKMAEEIGQQS